MRSYDAVCNIFGTLVVSLLLGAIPAKTQTHAVTLWPGVDVQSAVKANPENTTFIFQPGTYRFQMIQPKNGDTFVGQNNPVLSGAAVLTNFNKQGNLWVVTGQTQQGGPRVGECQGGYPRCAYPEDLFFDNVPLLHVDNLAAVAPGSWYFDYPNDQIFFADNPAGHLVETSITSSAFFGNASNVTITGLTIEKYATPAQYGAIGGQSQGMNWTMNNNEVRLNHSGGISVSDGGTATNNYVHNNGQKGFGGNGSNLLVEGNEVSFNNYAGFSCGWECGGMKFGGTSWLTVRGNNIHDNASPGIWSDDDNIYTLYENNTITGNTGGAGIQHEISYSAVIRYNNICNNSDPGQSNWLWASQILIQNSQDVQVYENAVETAFASLNTSPGSVGSNGIGIIQQDRGSGVYGPHIAAYNWIHNNNIIYRGAVASGELSSSAGFDLLNNGGNAFDYNTYHLVDPGWWHWVWVDQSATFSIFQQKFGQELHGTVDTNVPTAACTLSLPQTEVRMSHPGTKF